MCRFSPTVNISSREATTRVSSYGTQRPRRGATCLGHEYAIKFVAFNADSKRIASGTLTGEVKVWDAIMVLS